MKRWLKNFAILFVSLSLLALLGLAFAAEPDHFYPLSIPKKVWWGGLIVIVIIAAYGAFGEEIG